MVDKRFDYVSHEQNKEIEAVIATADALDLSVVNQLNNVKYFLKSDQHKLIVNEPSVSAAEAQMKALAAFFNEKRAFLEKCIEEIDTGIAKVMELAVKLEKGGHQAKSIKVSDTTLPLQEHKTEIAGLIDQVNEAKKEKLEELRGKILKAERVRHFKNLQ